MEAIVKALPPELVTLLGVLVPTLASIFASARLGPCLGVVTGPPFCTKKFKDGAL
jgi:hypothetical protein